jgi:predicted enzyme related to lactoylglutathione lyase
MSQQTPLRIGSVMWADLTVPHAEAVRDFYREVVGWTTTDVDMGGYHDFCMNQPEDAKTVAGICHARGSNAAVPPQWLIYIIVEDLEESMARCRELGGAVILPPRDYGGAGRYAVLRDPAGAAFALFEPDNPAA